MAQVAGEQKILWSPLQIGRMTVDGRVFKSATSETRATEEGFVTDELLDFYAPMAKAGTPMIITGNICVSRQGHSARRQASIDADDKLPGMREWVDVVHRHGVKLIAQLNHGGRQVVRPDAAQNPVVSASAVRQMTLGTKPRALRTDEIPGVIESFAAAAARAREAGFAGVQLHFAHGYLISQFLAPHTNRRTDQYGGGLRNRMRLPLEILEAVRKRVGDDYPVLAKINGTDALAFRGGASDTELRQFAKALENGGVDAIEISRAHYESIPPMLSGSYRNFVVVNVTQGVGSDFSPFQQRLALTFAPLYGAISEWTAPKGEGYNLPYAEKIKADLAIPVIANGGFVSRPAMEAAVSSGRADAVSCARAMICDPYLYRHLYSPEAEAPVCVYCNGCIARLGRYPVDCYDEAMGRRRKAMLGHG
jgi:2,4-dienoyl-CoA reductase-like NADH-dependent reductase (Old Yellow Enzyme family)